MILVVLSLPISYISTGLTPKADLLGSKIIPPIPHVAPVPGNSDPAGDEWPMFRGSLNHTGTTESTPVKGSGPLWTFSAADMIVSSPAVVDGRVYVGSNDGNIYCLNATTGAQVWNYPTTGMVTSSPAVSDGRVYVGSNDSLEYDSNLYCLNAITGALVWQSPGGEDGIISSPAVANGLLYCGWIGGGQGDIFCLNANNGEYVSNTWSGMGPVYSSPAVADGYVFDGESRGVLYCMNSTLGIVWKYNSGAGTYSPAVANGRVYTGSGDGKMYCLNESTGEFLWSFTTGGEVGSSPAVANGRVYMGSDDRNVYCLDATTGAFVWNYTTGYHVRSSPAVANGLVFVGSDDNITYCLNATTGTVVWKYATGASVFSSPAIANGCVYIGSEDHKLYCLPMLLTPSSPENIMAIGNNEHVSLKWLPPANDSGSPVTNYRVYRGLSLGNEVFLANAGNQLSYIDSNLVNGRAYYYAISAVTAAGEGSKSGDIIGIPMTTAEAPINLQAFGGMGAVTLTWQAPMNNGGAAIMTYNIYRGTSPEIQIFLATVESNTMTFTDTLVTGDSSYYYSIRSVNAAGEGLESNIASARPSIMIFIYAVLIIAAGIGIFAIVFVARRRAEKPTEISLSRETEITYRAKRWRESEAILFIYLGDQADLFHIREIYELLRKEANIEKVRLSVAGKSGEDILRDYDIMVLFCPYGGKFPEGSDEWKKFYEKDLPVIPIFRHLNDVPVLLGSKLGVEFNASKLAACEKAIYEIIMKIRKERSMALKNDTN